LSLLITYTTRSPSPLVYARLCSPSILFFFFFQAEDGIRDRTVTGVQTCALPIFSAAAFYALAELMIGAGAFAVPPLFAAGNHFLRLTGQIDSFRYLSLSALVLAASILPWCIFMGATFPLMMAYIREREEQARESFSYLY